MAALNLLRRLAVREVYPYAVDRISIGRHRWCILHIEKDGSNTKFLIEKYDFSEAEELLVFFGVEVSLDLYRAER